MGNMRHCRYENTAQDLQAVWDEWWDDDPDDLSEYEARGRKRIIRLVAEMHAEFDENDTYSEVAR